MPNSVYIYIYIYIRGAFNKFPDFKIVVDTWKYSMLLLYILWDDKPIFKISGLNEQLQQQLEYTILNPDCHSWWNSKMQFGRDDTLEERYAIKFCFKLGNCLIGWGCRIHRLHLCKGVPPNECPGYDTKQFDVEVPVMLELWGMWRTLSLPLVLGPLWPGIVAPDRAQYMG